jgi:hypothetical protein
MMMQALPSRPVLTDEEFAAAWQRAGCSAAAMARQNGLTERNVHRRRKSMARRGIELAKPAGAVVWRSEAPGDAPMQRPLALRQARPQVQRWLLTAAQDDTPVFMPFWQSLTNFARHIGAEIRVAGFTYQKGLFEDHATRTAAFADVVQPHLDHENVDLGPLLWAAKMNILPTAVKPLSGLETFSRGRWAVFPHAKVQLVSVPAKPGESAPHIMTTGACTVPNYIEKKAGQKAEFHHQIGAVLVELDGEGRLFARHISAADDGSFQDLTTRVAGDRVFTGERIEAATWGDIHRIGLDPVVARTVFGLELDSEAVDQAGSVIDVLKPRHQVFQDLLDFKVRNHHRRGDPHFKVKMHARGTDSVEAEVAQAARFLRQTSRNDCISIIAASNHNDALVRWLREASPADDAANARYWCQLSARLYEAIEAGDEQFCIIRHALAAHDPLARGLADMVFVPRNGSFVVCQSAGGVEVGAHGDEGPNGARGNPNNLARVAMRMVIGHGHSPQIIDGVWMAGIFGTLDQGYNTGPSGWSHSFVITHANAKRQMITMDGGKWWA